MNYASQSRRPNPAALAGALGIPAAVGALLVVGLAVEHLLAVLHMDVFQVEQELLVRAVAVEQEYLLLVQTTLALLVALVVMVVVAEEALLVATLLMLVATVATALFIFITRR